MHRESHTLKGSLMTIGAMRAGTTASGMAVSGKTGQLEDMQRLLPELIEEVQNFVEATRNP